METIFGQNPEVCEVKMGFSLRVSHFLARDPIKGAFASC